MLLLRHFHGVLMSFQEQLYLGSAHPDLKTVREGLER